MKPQMKVLPGGSGDTRRAVSTRTIDQEAASPLADFLVPQADNHGHSARIAGRIPPAMKHQISLLVGSKQFPWDGESDFIRWAIWRGTQEAAAIVKGKGFRSMQAVIDAWVGACRSQMEHLMFARALDTITRTVTDLLNSGATGPARKLVGQVEEDLERIDDPYWNKRFRRELVERFGHMRAMKGREGRD